MQKHLKTAILLEVLIRKFIDNQIIIPRDIIYIRNILYTKLHLNYVEIFNHNLFIDDYLKLNIPTICKKIINSLELPTILGDTYDIQETNLINTFLPPPHYIEKKFWHTHDKVNPKTALKWYYDFNIYTNYIKKYDLAKSLSWESVTQYGNLYITINLAKPEKDPHEIAQLKVSNTNSAYPKCFLCIENEGYLGDLIKPARQTHRMIELQLNKQNWYFQFSPYAYYNQHSILINANHCDMLINENTLKIFFEFLDFAPHYIIGSNSDIPIVGGSILNHDHYQTGDYIFPIEYAKPKFEIKSVTFPYLKIEYLNWPISTIKIMGSRNDIYTYAQILIAKWYIYDNHQLEIIAHQGEIRHNAVTPIMRKIDTDTYILYILLRNNRTTEKYPDGIFHPHRHLQHIKKENIGLIEAMGLAILPPRLSTELKLISELLLINDLNLALAKIIKYDNLLKHQKWLQELYKKYTYFDSNTINNLLQNEIGIKFQQILECCGVFKHNSNDDMALLSWIQNFGSRL